MRNTASIIRTVKIPVFPFAIFRTCVTVQSNRRDRCHVPAQNTDGKHFVNPFRSGMAVLRKHRYEFFQRSGPARKRTFVGVI
jgi:hypothetical protein